MSKLTKKEKDSLGYFGICPNCGTEGESPYTEEEMSGLTTFWSFSCKKCGCSYRYGGMQGFRAELNIALVEYYLGQKEVINTIDKDLSYMSKGVRNALKNASQIEIDKILVMKKALHPLDGWVDPRENDQDTQGIMEFIYRGDDHFLECNDIASPYALVDYDTYLELEKKIKEDFNN